MEDPSHWESYVQGLSQRVLCACVTVGRCVLLAGGSSWLDHVQWVEEAKASGPHLPWLETDRVSWHWWIRNSIQRLLEIDFPSGDLTSCFTSRGDQTVLGGATEPDLWKAFPFFFFLYKLYVSKRISNSSGGLNNTSLNPSWHLELWDIHTTHHIDALCRFKPIYATGFIKNPSGVGVNVSFPLFLSIFIDPLWECLKGKNGALIISIISSA